jgi:hypothetical protein
MNTIANLIVIIDWLGTMPNPRTNVPKTKSIHIYQDQEIKSVDCTAKDITKRLNYLK